MSALLVRSGRPTSFRNPGMNAFRPKYMLLMLPNSSPSRQGVIASIGMASASIGWADFTSHGQVVKTMPI